MNLILNEGYISNYSVEKIDEVIILTILGDISVKYKIYSDQRHLDIDKIYTTLKTALDDSKDDENANFKISEYLERNYIFVTLPNQEDSIKYSAQKLEIK